MSLETKQWLALFILVGSLGIIAWWIQSALIAYMDVLVGVAGVYSILHDKR